MKTGKEVNIERKSDVRNSIEIKLYNDKYLAIPVLKK
jgi:hypothetical protein